MSASPNRTGSPRHPVIASVVTATERMHLSSLDTRSSPVASRSQSLFLGADVPERILVQRIGSSPITPHAPHGDTYTVYHGSIVQSRSLHTLEFLHDAYIGVFFSAKTKKGIIEFIVGDRSSIPETPQWQNAVVRELGRCFLIPGMIDTHTHAPQFPNAGTGRIPLLEWLKKYTFPTESKFKNLGFAEAVYTRKVQRLISSGTTTACYYATIHLEASLVLRDVVEAAGQRAFIGKVCMDQNAPDFYVETTEQSVADTEKFVETLTKGPRASHLIQPIITPRFAPTCSAPLLSKLGDIAHDHNLTIQTHISENKDEIAWVKSLFPDCPNYASVYDRHRLLTDRTVLAHAIHLTPEEKQLIKDRKSGVSHCPNSNFSISSGVLDCGALLTEGIKVGLGTDVSGGYHYSMLDAVRQSVIAARSVEFMKRAMGQEDSKAFQPTAEPVDSSIDSSVLVTLHPNETPEFFDYQEGFYIATIGGSQLVGMEDKIGRLRVGYEFDAVLIDPLVFHSPFDVFDKDTPIDLFQKFMFLGDDRNVSEVYVSGRLVYTNGLPTVMHGTTEMEASPRVAALAERLKSDSFL